jgi:hypothetical protein
MAGHMELVGEGKEGEVRRGSGEEEGGDLWLHDNGAQPCCSVLLCILPVAARRREGEEREEKEEKKEEKMWKFFQTWKFLRRKIKDNLWSWCKTYFL